VKRLELIENKPPRRTVRKDFPPFSWRFFKARNYWLDLSRRFTSGYFLEASSAQIKEFFHFLQPANHFIPGAKHLPKEVGFLSQIMLTLKMEKNIGFQVVKKTALTRFIPQPLRLMRMFEKNIGLQSGINLK
jgi:hypothetical protein